MTAATLEYQCRRCKALYTGATGHKDIILTCLLQLGISGVVSLNGKIGSPPKLIDIHHCDDDGYGVSDLIGAKREIK